MTRATRLPSAVVTRVLSVAPDEVYGAWLDPSTLAHFICPAPGRATEIALDARIGGRFRFLMTFPDHEIEVTGRFLALDRPERIAFTWRCSDTGALESVVTVVFASQPAGRTLMTITHSRQPAEHVEQHRLGWESVAEQLSSRVAAPA